MIEELPIGLLSEEDKNIVIRLMGDYINDLGENVYHIGDGVLTGEFGWIKFNEILKNGIE